MTIQTEPVPVTYNGDGSTTAIPIPFKFILNSHVKATHRSGVTETPWIEGTHYTLTGAGEEDGGTLTVKTTPTDYTPQVGETLVVELDVPFTQLSALPLGGPLPSTTLEQMDDLDAQRISQLNQLLNRGLRVPTTDTQSGSDLELPIDSARANGVLGFDSLGKPTTASLTDESASAATATGAANSRTLSLHFRDRLHINDFSSLVSGGDWQAAIAAAITNADTQNVGEVWFDDAEYDIGSTISLGNGSASAFSTVNSIQLKGVGAPFVRLKDGTPPTKDVGTRFKWVGAAGGTMVEILGPCQGNGLSNIALNANDLADYCLRLISASRGRFDFLTMSDFTDTALTLDCVEAETISAITEGIGTEGNYFLCLRITGNDTASATVCIDIDGYLGSAVNGRDSLRNLFEDTYLLVNRVGGTGIRIAFADQNVFHHTLMAGFGVADGNQASLRFVRAVTVPGGFVFPQNNVFSGHTDIGQQLPVVVDASGIGEGHVIERITSLDEQVPITGHAARYIAGRWVDRNDFPVGGFWTEFGQNVSERSFRNKLINPTFHRATRGTSFTDPASGSYTLDAARIVYDGTPSFVLSRQDFTPGQTDVPYEPKHYLRIAQTGAIGGTFFHLQWRVRHVELFAARHTVLSAWIKADGSYSLTGRVEQNFGSGGSPSATNAALSDAITVDTSWERYDFQVLMPSISGKTLGSNDDDLLSIIFILPIAAGFTLDFALPQFESGDVSTAFDLRGEDIDEVMMGRYLQEIPDPGNLYAHGPVTTATQAEWFHALERPMAATPTLELAGVAGDYAIRDYVGANGAVCTGVPIIVAATPKGAHLRFTAAAHGLTLGTTARLEGSANGRLLLTAEL